MKPAQKHSAKRPRRVAAGGLAFRPDEPTRTALETISSHRPGIDTSTMLREAVQAYARELELERYVAAARQRGGRGEAVVEEFERAGDA